jgi:hypothetical protein
MIQKICIEVEIFLVLVLLVEKSDSPLATSFTHGLLIWSFTKFHNGFGKGFYIAKGHHPTRLTIHNLRTS